MLRQKNVFVYLVLLFTFLFACRGPQPAANIGLPNLFSDHMVLQQDIHVPIWGTADPKGTVTVEFIDQKVRAHSNDAGEWKILLKPLKAGGPYELKIIGTDTHIIRDILVGEVWLGSGQSNMEMPLAGWGKVENYEQEIAEASYPDIRLFQVSHKMSLTPEKEVPSKGWRICTPVSIPDFSSTAYFFGRMLHKELEVPVGLIHSSWGGTIIEAWMSAESLQFMPSLHQRTVKLKSMTEALQKQYDVPNDDDLFDLILKQWQDEIPKMDRGLNDPAGSWASHELETNDWDTMVLPNNWENEGLPGMDGIVWFRKMVDIPGAWIGKDLILNISAVDDIDETYFNGILVGRTEGWDAPRSYTVPKDLIKAGPNVIAIRVRDNLGGGGIWGDPALFNLSLDGQMTISLAGLWEYRIGLDWNELSTPALNPYNPNCPTLLSNGMIEPVIPYALRGIIWYQGESNTGNAYQYRELFPRLIRDWRQRWNQGNFPFLFVQLANFMSVKDQPGEDSWAELREAQLLTLSEPYTGMVVAIDIGDANDIHPKNKQEVGRRLALSALRIAYEQDVVASGPVYQSMQIENEKIRLTFSNIADSLVIKNGEDLKGFAIAGEDRVFRWAEATIDGDTVILWHPQIEEPVAARYAWASNPICNLYNSAGLPASPFRTDDWPGITER
ncbi:MAG: sialate O-acetylesterase [Candidatus Aminicenantes bacterium]|jgi:sialate O-acetylesterase